MSRIFSSSVSPDPLGILNAQKLITSKNDPHSNSFSKRESSTIVDFEDGDDGDKITNQDKKMENSDWLPEPFGAFTDSSIRKKFIMKVYGILSVQLSMTIFLGILFLSIPQVKDYFRHRPLFAVGAVVVAMIPLLVLVCGGKIRRRYPWNFILLTIFSLLQGFGIAVLTCALDNSVVISAFIISAVAVLSVSILSAAPCLDITKCGTLIMALFGVQLAMGLVMFFVVRFGGLELRPLHLLYSILGAAVFMLFLAYDTQTILGGRKVELDPEEYIFAAVQLYLDILNIFLYILQIMNMSGGGGSPGGMGRMA